MQNRVKTINNPIAVVRENDLLNKNKPYRVGRNEKMANKDNNMRYPLLSFNANVLAISLESNNFF